MVLCLLWMAGVMVLMRQILPWEGFDGAAVALLVAALLHAWYA